MARVPKALRIIAQQRATARCEYCRRPDLTEVASFHVDHILPLTHGDETVLDNLAYACAHCNHHKSRDIASIDPDTGMLVRLYNPRTQQWNEHFRLDQLALKGISPEGRVTVIVLQLNSPAQMALREMLIANGLW